MFTDEEGGSMWQHSDREPSFTTKMNSYEDPCSGIKMAEVLQQGCGRQGGMSFCANQGTFPTTLLSFLVSSGKPAVSVYVHGDQRSQWIYLYHPPDCYLIATWFRQASNPAAAASFFSLSLPKSKTVPGLLQRFNKNPATFREKIRTSFNDGWIQLSNDTCEHANRQSLKRGTAGDHLKPLGLNLRLLPHNFS